MKAFDLRRFDDFPSCIETDLCIVGSGPAGLTIANELAGASIGVLVVESGGFDDDAQTQSLYEIESTGNPRTIDQSLIRRRILGGSSHVWSGRCAPFDPVDFERRPWVPFSGWPIEALDIESLLPRAAAYLGLGNYGYDEDLWNKFKVRPPNRSLEPAIFEPMFWQSSRGKRNRRAASHFGRDHLPLDAPNIDLLLHANLTHINLNPDGTQFESIEVSTLNSRQVKVKAKNLVLCCGGIENARLLLASNRIYPEGVGNRNDTVGRFLMDHIDCPIGKYDPAVAYDVRSRFGNYWIDDEAGRHLYEHGIAIGRDTQQKEKLLNCHAFMIEFDPVPDDPWPALKRIASTRRPSRQTLSDAKTILGRTPDICDGLVRRTFKHRPQIEARLRSELHLMMEQAPNPDSRVTLSSDKRDALGMPISSLHWKVGELERRTAATSARLIFNELKRLNLPVPQEIMHAVEQADWISCCAEKAHPTGTTRMSDGPKEGVVDRHCQVHGVQGLFVAGSSVFPTAGAANPTLMIVAMAIRIADRLKATMSRSAPAILGERLFKQPTSDDRIKVGLIGAGKRISEFHIPLLQKLSDTYHIAGVVGRSPEGAVRLESTTGITAFQSARGLVDETHPAFLIVAISDDVNAATIDDLLDLGFPVLSETPLAWSADTVRGLIRKAAEKGIALGVAEQFPFLPLEQFKQRLFEREAFGDIHAATNDFHSYSYHGIAQLRRYIEGVPVSVRNVERIENDLRWNAGSVSFNNGATLFHNHGLSGPSPHPSVQIRGSVRTMTDCQIVGFGGRIAHLLRKTNPSGRLLSISATIQDVGDVTWTNPFSNHDLSDEEIAVATLLEAMAKGQPLYTANDFLTDIEIVQALRFSAETGGRAVALPLREKLEKGRRLASPHFWKSRIARRQ